MLFFTILYSYCFLSWEKFIKSVFIGDKVTNGHSYIFCLVNCLGKSLCVLLYSPHDTLAPGVGVFHTEQSGHRLPRWGAQPPREMPVTSVRARFPMTSVQLGHRSEVHRVPFLDSIIARTAHRTQGDTSYFPHSQLPICSWRKVALLGAPSSSPQDLCLSAGAGAQHLVPTSVSGTRVHCAAYHRYRIYNSIIWGGDVLKEKQLKNYANLGVNGKITAHSNVRKQTNAITIMKSREMTCPFINCLTHRCYSFLSCIF